MHTIDRSSSSTVGMRPIATSTVSASHVAAAAARSPTIGWRSDLPPPPKPPAAACTTAAARTSAAEDERGPDPS